MSICCCHNPLASLAVLLFAIISVPAASQNWTPGEMFGKPADANTTGGIMLALGNEPGAYRIGGSAAEVSFQFFLPKEAQIVGIPLTGSGTQRHVFAGDEGSIEIQALDPSTIVVDMEFTGNRSPLAMMQLSVDNSATTNTITYSEGGMEYQISGQAIYFLTSEEITFRDPDTEGFRIVVPMSSQKKQTRFVISTQPLSPAKVRQLNLNANLALRPDYLRG